MSDFAGSAFCRRLGTVLCAVVLSVGALATYLAVSAAVRGDDGGGGSSGGAHASAYAQYAASLVSPPPPPPAAVSSSAVVSFAVVAAGTLTTWTSTGRRLGESGAPTPSAAEAFKAGVANVAGVPIEDVYFTILAASVLLTVELPLARSTYAPARAFARLDCVLRGGPCTGPDADLCPAEAAAAAADCASHAFGVTIEHVDAPLSVAAKPPPPPAPSPPPPEPVPPESPLFSPYPLPPPPVVPPAPPRAPSPPRRPMPASLLHIGTVTHGQTCAEMGMRSMSEAECRAMAFGMSMLFETHNGTLHHEEGCHYWNNGYGIIEYMHVAPGLSFPVCPPGRTEVVCFCNRN